LNHSSARASPHLSVGTSHGIFPVHGRGQRTWVPLMGLEKKRRPLRGRVGGMTGVYPRLCLDCVVGAQRLRAPSRGGEPGVSGTADGGNQETTKRKKNLEKKSALGRTGGTRALLRTWGQDPTLFANLFFCKDWCRSKFTPGAAAAAGPGARASGVIQVGTGQRRFHRKRLEGSWACRHSQWAGIAGARVFPSGKRKDSHRVCCNAEDRKPEDGLCYRSETVPGQLAWSKLWVRLRRRPARRETEGRIGEHGQTPTGQAPAAPTILHRAEFCTRTKQNTKVFLL